MGTGQHAHHMFSQKFSDTWQQLRINWDGAENGVWWEATDDLKNAYGYNKMWEECINANASLIKNDSSAAASKAYEFARELAEKYGLKW